MKYFHMPADFKRETIDAYGRLNEAYKHAAVQTTYGNVTVHNVFGSGRNVDKLPKADLDDLKEYVRYSQDKDIDFAYTLNPSFLQNREFTKEGLADIRAFLDELHEAGVRDLIIAMPSLMEIARESGHEFRIKASAICTIDTPNKARRFKKMGVDGMVADEGLNRDFRSLKAVREAFGPSMQVIVNSICIQDCQFRPFHYNQISGDSMDTPNPVSCAYYPVRCALRMYNDLANYFRTTWIRPEDLKHYTAIGITHFKLQGRQSVAKGDPVRAVECYMQERYDGDLKELLFLFGPSEAFQLAVDNRTLDDFLKPFVEDPEFCRRDCATCSYCEQWAQRCFGNEEAQQMVAKAKEVLHSKDPFAAMLREGLE